VHGIVVARDVMVPMRDGVRLATDVYRPAANGEPLPGRFPALLGRTSYDKSAGPMWVEPVAEHFTRRGYVVVLQDLRGRHSSEGTGQYFHTANVREGLDGYDTVEWIAAQPWSNGRVGTVGSSHGAIVQQVLALHRPPHLSAIWPDVGPTNVFAHEAREGGAMCLHMYGALYLHAHDAQELRDDPEGKRALFDAMAELGQHVDRFLRPGGVVPGQTPLRVVPNLERVLFDYYRRGCYDEFWAHECCDQERQFARHADVPGVYSGGWFDPFSVATTNYYAAMARQNETPQRLIMGPWSHTAMRGAGTSVVGDVDFGPEARWGDAAYNAERLRWFDRWLRDEPTAVEDDPPVRIFVMGGGTGRRTAEGKLDHGGRWRAEREWPLARAEPITLYLRADGQIATEAADGAPASFTYDPADPVPTVGGAVTGFYELLPIPEGYNTLYLPPRARMRSLVLDGPTDQRPLDARRDVLRFRSWPLREPLEVTGSAEVRLWVSSTAEDTDFTAKLVDVYPDGYAMLLVDSIRRGRFRDGYDREELMTPGEPYEVVIPLPPTSNLFMPGHRIRLDVSSSSFPRFDPNPNTGEPLGRHTRTVSAVNTVYLDRARPSRIVLPLIR
jgi:putative CocE/NonD family hydrolase